MGRYSFAQGLDFIASSDGIWVPDLGGFGCLAPVGRLLDMLQLIIESKGRNRIPIRSVSEGNSSNVVTRRRLRRARERSPLA